MKYTKEQIKETKVKHIISTEYSIINDDVGIEVIYDIAYRIGRGKGLNKHREFISMVIKAYNLDRMSKLMNREISYLGNTFIIKDRDYNNVYLNGNKDIQDTEIPVAKFIRMVSQDVIKFVQKGTDNVSK